MGLNIPSPAAGTGSDNTTANTKHTEINIDKMIVQIEEIIKQICSNYNF